MTRNLPRKSEKSVKIGTRTSNGPRVFGGPSGGTYPGNSRGMLTPASLSRVYSPPQQRGAHGPLGSTHPLGIRRTHGPWALGQPPLWGGEYSREEGSSRGLAPPWPPLSLGVPSRYVLLVNLLLIWVWFAM